MHPFKWNPSKGLFLPAVPSVMPSFRSYGASLLHNTDSISPRRPPPPGDGPADGPAYPPAPASLLSPIERTKCGRKNILMDEYHQPVPLPPTKENLALLSWTKKWESSWIFNKLKRHRKDSEKDKEPDKSAWTERVLWAEAGEGEPVSVRKSEKEKEKERGFENLALCIEGNPSLAFSQDWSQDLIAFQVLLYVGPEFLWMTCCKEDRPQGGLQSRLFVKLKIHNAFLFYIQGAEQSSIRASQFLFPGRIRLARTQHNLRLFRMNFLCHASKFTH